VSRYQKGETNLDFTEARDSEWHWHHLGHMQVCTSLQTDNHASTPPLSFFTGRMPFLPPNQQRQSTEGTYEIKYNNIIVARTVYVILFHVTCFMKVVEKIFEHRIRQQIEIDDMQFGFMKGKGNH